MKICGRLNKTNDKVVHPELHGLCTKVSVKCVVCDREGWWYGNWIGPASSLKGVVKKECRQEKAELITVVRFVFQGGGRREIQYSLQGIPKNVGINY
jgi:hypothetical protein